MYRKSPKIISKIKLIKLLKNMKTSLQAFSNKDEN